MTQVRDDAPREVSTGMHVRHLRDPFHGAARCGQFVAWVNGTAWELGTGVREATNRDTDCPKCFTGKGESGRNTASGDEQTVGHDPDVRPLALTGRTAMKSIRHTGPARTQWLAGPLDRATAEAIVAAITAAVPRGCFPARYDRPEGASVTRRYGTLTVALRGCTAWRAEAWRIAATYDAEGGQS
jgi:hypothetical protein